MARGAGRSAKIEKDKFLTTDANEFTIYDLRITSLTRISSGTKVANHQWKAGFKTTKSSSAKKFSRR